MKAAPPPAPAKGRTVLGMLLIGTGRSEGFARFGTSADAFLASLAPLLGIVIVLSGLVAWTGRPVLGITFFLLSVCDLLAPAIIADLFCRLWHRRERWGLHANVLNCSQWLIFAVLVMLMPAATLAIGLGVPKEQAAQLLLVGWFVYILWFHWFAARHALALSAGRALLVMMAIVFGTGLLLQIPVYAGMLSGLQAVPEAPAPPAGANGSGS